jgi:ABC-2 type transport system permease protein
MAEKYSQTRASLALAKASLIATLRSPTSVVFALAFPLIFVTVFGAMVDNNAIKINLVLSPHSDTTGAVFAAMKTVPLFELSVSQDSLATIADLEKGRVDAVVYISKNDIRLLSSGATGDKLPIIRSALQETATRLSQQVNPGQIPMFRLQVENIPGRVYRRIDFILPGQLGFSLLMAGVFGSAFLLFNLRHTLVLKRLYATPILPSFVLLGEMISHLLFQIICFVIITALGYFAFHFTLVNGFVTFLEMLLLSVFGLVIFTGIGFVISGRIRNESSIAPIANLLTVPQILLCGLFFPIDNYPTWLRTFCEALPLTFFVTGLRKIAFEGLHIWQLPIQLTGLAVWTIVIGVLAVRAFRWE